MIDTQRLQSTPRCVSGIAELAALCARRREDSSTHPIEITSYFPIDVETVTRILESLDERADIHNEERDGVRWVVIEHPDDYNLRVLDLERGEHLECNATLMRHIAQLAEDPGWARRVREQHELMWLAASAREQDLDLSYFTSRTDLPSARVQSLLNDLGAGGQIDIVLDEEAGALHYRFPPFEYPRPRFERNMAFLDQLPSPEWRPVLAAAMAVALAVVLALILSTRLHMF